MATPQSIANARIAKFGVDNDPARMRQFANQIIGQNFLTDAEKAQSILQYAEQAGFDDARLAQITGIAPSEIARGRGLYTPVAPTTPAAPKPFAPPETIPTGLRGSEEARGDALRGSIGALLGGAQQARGDLMNMYNQGRADLQAGLGRYDRYADQAYGLMGQGADLFRERMGDFDPFIEGGTDAYNKIAALSGALGPEAQEAAYGDFRESPATQFLREQGERAVTRNAAALGGLGGGNVMKELNRFGQGLAQQDYGNYYNRLAGLSDAGLGAINNRQSLTGALAAQLGNQANVRLGQGQAGLGVGQNLFQGQQNLGGTLGNISLGLGSNIGNALLGQGNLLAQDRLQVGRDIADRSYDTNLLRSDLQGDLGTQLGNLLGGAGGEWANQLLTGGQLSGQNLSNLAQLLGNISTGSATQFAGLPSLPGVQFGNSPMEGIGNAIAGIGAAMASDRRLKKNIEKIGKLPSGTNIYKWDWKGINMGPGFGVIAQEVPHASFMHPSGYLMVDYSKVA